MRSILFIILSLSLFSCEKSVNDSASFEVFVDGVFVLEEEGGVLNQINESQLYSFVITFSSDNFHLVSNLNSLTEVNNASILSSVSPLDECINGSWNNQNPTISVVEKNGSYSGTYESKLICDSDKSIRVEFSNYELN